MTTDKPDVGALVPIAYVVQSLRDGSIGNLIAPTAWSTFEDAKERLEQDPWIVNGAAKLAPLYSHETVLSLQSEVARLTRQNDDHAAYIAGIEREREDARKDAERYRWLRDRYYDHKGDVAFYDHDRGIDYKPKRGKSLDAAIDARKP